MVTYEEIYEAFLGQIESDEWNTWEEWEAQEDWKQLLNAAIPLFKFPRVDLYSTDEAGFLDEDMGLPEIQVLVGYMKAIWLERVVNSWENLRPLYSERDFSPATMLNELRLKLTQQVTLADNRERRYYRSDKGKPFPFRNLSGR